MSVLEVRDLCHAYFAKGQDVLKHVSLDVTRGQVVAISGPSGSGKSTLLQLVGGLERPRSGSVRIDGEDLSKLSDVELSRFRRRRLGFVFQAYNLVPSLTVAENVALPLLLDGVSTRAAGERARALLERCGIAALQKRFPRELSGGEQQRTAVARALVADPALILADEPTGSLDSSNGKMVMDLLLGEPGRTVLLVTHDPALSARAERVVGLRDGVLTQDSHSA